jgi:hypothetical protein
VHYAGSYTHNSKCLGALHRHPNPVPNTVIDNGMLATFLGFYQASLCCTLVSGGCFLNIPKDKVTQTWFVFFLSYFGTKEFSFLLVLGTYVGPCGLMVL